MKGFYNLRRSGVTVAADWLSHAGLSRYSRGHIQMIDRSSLEMRIK
ncbi:MAG: hypothetical protein RBJ76_07420 [Stenomitos frigidus ULC029]